MTIVWMLTIAASVIAFIWFMRVLFKREEPADRGELPMVVVAERQRLANQALLSRANVARSQNQRRFADKGMTNTAAAQESDWFFNPANPLSPLSPLNPANHLNVGHSFTTQEVPSHTQHNTAPHEYGTRDHHSFATGGGFGGERNDFHTGGSMNDHSSSHSSSSSSYDSGSSYSSSDSSSSSSDGGGGGGGSD